MPPTTAAADHHPSKKSNISDRQWACLTLTILLQLLILLLLNLSSLRHFQSSPLRRDDESCKHGRIHVYNLPSMLNKDLLHNCHHLDPWSSRCSAVSNGGLGPPATGLHALVPLNLSPAWHWTDMYSAEVIFHDRINNYRCTTPDPAQAAAFYIPFYAGLAIGKYLWYNYTSKHRDLHASTMLNWVKTQPAWLKSNGSDHFLMFGRLTWDFRRLTDSDSEWGSSFIYMPLMKNVLRLTIEKSRWDDLELSVPYPTAFHPRSGSDIRQWQAWIRARKRPTLSTFVGATRKKIRNDFRAVMMGYCRNETTSCRVVDCSETQCYDGAPAILQAFLDSDFCLQPKGDGFTRRSAFDCMLAGSIPVFFWRGSFEYQYDWHLPKNASKYSIFIDHNIVRNDTSIIKRTLEKYSKEEVKRMRETIIHFLPKLLYSKSNANLGGIEDAFDIAMDGVLKRFEQQRRSMAV
ncbi:xyloglucan galactosyltransferase XLT2-like [Salvia hispanica]|uniref:xyloglucan galactosyltransferase XLT2-like n=1 Tax=Salvia hispanica TaxID=49212 RepID=UPI002009C96F|nr:xyloglucan galactosyltransferase XLT2-like [Salvia hispanica]XP_047947635.1 xyloglucan galactosyltransferase XLT2-like [Salvia hispanica]